MDKVLVDAYHTLARNITPMVNKENMTQSELEMLYRSVCTMEKIKKIESIDAEMSAGEYSEKWGYGYGGGQYPMHDSYPVSYGGRHRNAMGQFTSRMDQPYHTQDNYSGHSINDRMIDSLERMYDQAQTDHERNKIRMEIDRLRANPD